MIIFPLMNSVTHAFIKLTQAEVFKDFKRIIKKNFVLRRSFYKVRYKTVSFVSSIIINIFLK